MTLLEAAKQAQDFLMTLGTNQWGDRRRVLQSLSAAIEAAGKQAPVAWGILASNTGKMCSVVRSEDEVSEYDPKHIVPLYTAPAVPEGWKLVPIEPTKEMWGGLARDLMMWLDMSRRPTSESLFEHLKNCGREVPQWMLDEDELKNPGVPSKGTRAVLIYKSMLNAAPEKS